MLRISLFGEQAISDASGSLRVRSSRTVELVAFLAVHAHLPQSRQRIATLFWPDSTEAQALTNLRRELHNLRNVLGDESALVVTAKDLSWRDTDSCTVDVRIFERERAVALAAAAAGDDERTVTHAAAAVGQYRGELLPDSYDDWLLDARAEFERGCVALLDLLCEARVRTGDLIGAVAPARRRIELRPLEEVGYRTLMQLQGDLGERAGAVSTYHHCASVLERELGIEPDPQTSALLDRLLARAATAAPVVPVASARARRSGLGAAHLVGRAVEFEQLEQVWRTAAAGRASLALVRGAAGVGKTRLVADIAEMARAGGAITASAQCFGTSGQLALSPVADWLRTPAVQSGMANLEPVWRAEVDRLVPLGNARTQPDAAVLTRVEDWQRHRFFEGLARALLAVGRPTFLVLDNVQWCDQETLAFLTFCLARTVDAPIMIAATLRDEEYGEVGLAPWMDRMRTTGLVTDVTLTPLDVADASRLAEAISGRTLDDDDATLLLAATGGFPLYIVEAARGAVDLGSGRLPAGDLTAVLRHRLDQVSAAARDIAALAAAVGRNFTLDLLTEASDLDADSVVTAVDELWRGRIVRELDDGYDFTHDLLREVAYAQITPPKRWLLHRRIAQGLELLHAADPSAISAQLAEQYARGGRIERAVGYYRRAAEVAADIFAYAEAIRLDKEALALLSTLPETKDRIQQELAVTEAMAAPLNAKYGYSSPDLRSVLDRSIALAEVLGRRDSIVTGLVGLWASQFVRGETEAAYQTATRALAVVEPQSRLQAAAHFAVGGSAVNLGRPAEAVSHLEHAALLGGSDSLTIGTRPDVHGLAFVAHAHWLLGQDDAALTCADGAITLARSTANPYNVTVALAYAAITHRLRNDVPAVQRTVGELRELCDRHGYAYYREWALILGAWSQEDGSGLEVARRGVENLSAAGSFARMPFWLAMVADIATRGGREDYARGTLDAAIVRGQASNDLWWLPEVMRMRARYDNEPAAIARLRAAAALASVHGSVALVARATADLTARGIEV